MYGINKISRNVQQFELRGVAELFSDLEEEDVKFPDGEIDVLIGFEYAGFHPVRKQSSDHILLPENRFGKCLGGLSPDAERKDTEAHSACCSLPCHTSCY